VSKVNDNLVSAGLAVLMLIVARPLPVVQQPTLATVTSISSIGKVSTMFGASAQLCYYAKHICKIVYPWNSSFPGFGGKSRMVSSAVDFKTFLDQEGIDAVAVTPSLFRVSLLAKNPTFGRFVETATKNGWIRHDLPAPEGESYLYVLKRISPPS
jgi:hypothetical protein